MQGRSIDLGIVVAEFNHDVTRLMLEKAEDHARFLGANVAVIARVPGTYDMALMVKELLSRDDVDAVVTLGAVIKGETRHDEIVATQAARKLLDLSVEYGKPVALGIIGHGATREQAVERAEEYAARAVESAVKMAMRIRALREGKGLAEGGAGATG